MAIGLGRDWPGLSRHAGLGRSPVGITSAFALWAPWSGLGDTASAEQCQGAGRHRCGKITRSWTLASSCAAGCGVGWSLCTESEFLPRSLLAAVIVVCCSATARVQYGCVFSAALRQSAWLGVAGSGLGKQCGRAPTAVCRRASAGGVERLLSLTRIDAVNSTLLGSSTARILLSTSAAV